MFLSRMKLFSLEKNGEEETIELTTELLKSLSRGVSHGTQSLRRSVAANRSAYYMSKPIEAQQQPLRYSILPSSIVLNDLMIV